MPSLCASTGKQCRPTMHAAREHARHLRQDRGYVAVAYRCPACGWFHIGAQKPKVKPIRGQRMVGA